MALGSPEWMYSSGKGFYPLPIESSCRFDQPSGSDLTRTPSVAGNRRTWTWSGWIKRTLATTDGDGFFTGASSQTDRVWLQIRASSTTDPDTISCVFENADVQYLIRSTAVFRDPSAWYHVVVALDTTQATASDRVNIYVNGDLLTDFISEQYPPLNEQYQVNNTVEHVINDVPWSPNFNGDQYMSEVNFIDGQALTPEDFGEFKSGVWVPKKYTGTYGTNGFRLDFGNSGTGPDLVTNGTFNDGTTTGWTAIRSATIANISNQLRVTCSASLGFGAASQGFATEIGKTYRVKASVSGVSTSNRGYVIISTSPTDFTPELVRVINQASSAQTGEATFVATTTTSYINLMADGVNDSATFDNVSAVEVLSTDLGTDSSGNGNDYTPSGLDASDQMLDTPTNNFATWNPISPKTTAPLSEGNLRASPAAISYTESTIAINRGAWYLEKIVNNSDTEYWIGADNSGNSLGVFTSLRAYRSNGQYYNGSAWVAYGATYGPFDFIGMAVDVEAGTIEFFKNGVSQGVKSDVPSDADIVRSAARFTYVINFGQDSSFAGAATRQGNTDANGQGDFYYAPPAGFLALCSANLPDPIDAINPAKDGSPQDFFNTLLYTGNGSATTRNITGVGFQPDFVWLKNRNTTNNHALFDVVRGAGLRVISALDNAELDETADFDSFDSDGFTISTTESYINGNTNSIVAWNWKAGGSAVTNNDGAQSSQVSANPDLGFSIVSITPSGGQTTYGHGLSKAPEIIFNKNRTVTSEWVVWTSLPDGSWDFVRLDTTDAATNSAQPLPSSSVFTANLTSGNDYINYCFHSVEGFSKFGNYIGNGSDDGPFVYCGFRPAYVLIKRTDSTTNSNWTLLDDERDSYNSEENVLYANLGNAEATGVQADFVSNGFKVRAGNVSNVNTNGGTYLFMAFAENPFKYALGR